MRNALLFSVLFCFCLSILQCQSIPKQELKHNLSFCNYEFREYEKENIPYTLSFIEDTIKNIRFDAYSTNLFDETFNPDNCNQKPLHFSLYNKKIINSDKPTLFIFINEAYIPIKEKLDYATYIPQRLSFFEYKGVAYLLFQLDNFSPISSMNTRLSYTTILLKLNADNETEDQFIYTSLDLEEPKSVLARYETNDKEFY